MTADDRKLEAFFQNVVDVLGTKYVRFHHPQHFCFKGLCEKKGTGPFWSSERNCNWKPALELTAWFWKHGPDVDGKWRGAARRGNIDPNRFHEFLLGVFIGGDTRPAGNYKRSTITLGEAGFDGVKAGVSWEIRNAKRHARRKVAKS